MSPECLYSDHHDCDRWLDYQIALLALEDAKDLTNENWNEIRFLLDRVEQLETLLRSANHINRLFCFVIFAIDAS